MSTEYPFLIDGQWRTSDETLEVTNPYNGETMGKTYRPSPKDVEEAIQSSVKTFEMTKKMSSYQRSEILRKAALEIDRRKEELARMFA